MMNILILPEEIDSYRALSGDKESTGRTPGQALDALRSQLTEEEEDGTLVILQSHKPDRFFGAAQQERLAELMRLRDAGELTAEDEGELERLVEAELHGARLRAEDMSDAIWRIEEPFPSTPEDLLELKELLEKCLADMPDEEKNLFMWSSLGMSSEEIATRLGVSGPTVRKRLSRFKAKLRASIEQNIDRRRNLLRRVPSSGGQPG